MKAIIYDLEDENLADIQLDAIHASLKAMSDDVKPKYVGESYTSKKYHPTENKLCLSLELGRFPEWDMYIKSTIKKEIKELTNDWIKELQ